MARDIVGLERVPGAANGVATLDSNGRVTASERQYPFGKLAWPGGYIHVLSTGTGSAGTDSQARGQILPIAQSITVDRIGIDVSVAGTAAATARLGIYRIDPDNMDSPTLVLDAGTVAIDATGQQELTISQALTPGWYAVVMVKSDTSGEFERVTGSGATAFSEGAYGTTYAAGSSWSGVVIPSVTLAGGLPSAPTNMAPYPTTVMIYLRRAS